MRQVINSYKKYKDILNFLLLQIIVFTLMFSSLVVNNGTMLMLLSLIAIQLSFLSYFCIYRVYKSITSHVEMKLEMKLYQEQQKMKIEHLKVLKENRQQMDKLRDILREKLDEEGPILINQKDAREKAQNLINRYAHLYYTDYCKNKTIDAILYHKLQQAKLSDITCSTQIILPEKLPIKDIDLMSLFTNLLDNAIESCEVLPKNKRFISVEAICKANFLSIRIQNAKDESINVNSINMLSTKSDAENHGLGLQIINNICNKYDGNLKIDDQGSIIDIYAILSLNCKI